MALKKPSDFINGGNPKDTNVNEPFTEIKEEFNQYSWSRNKLDELKRQVDNVTSSLNYSLAETVDKNLNFLSQEYSDLLEKFNQKIITLKEEIDNKVDTLQSSNTDLLADIEILDKRQKKINSRNIDKITEEVLAEIKIILSGDFKSNIQRLEEKIDNVSNSYQTLNEGLLNEPPSTDNSDPLTPLDQNFVTQKDLADHYTNFLNRVQAQIATIGGGGAVRIDQLDDVEISTAKVNGKFLRYNSTKGKWEGADASGGGGGSGISNVVEDTSPQLGGNLDLNNKNITGTGNISITGNANVSTLNVVGVSTFNEDVQFKGASSNMTWDRSASDLTLFDNTRLIFGNNEDFQIWHGGAHTFMKNSGGDLRIRSNTLILKNQDDDEKYIQCNNNSSVQLFFNNNQKFVTTNTGVVITGICTATSFSGDGSGLTGIVGSGSGVVIQHDGSNVGTAGTINFSTNLDVSAISSGIVTVTATGGGDVVSDTSPQLGGDLDVNGKDIVSASNGNIEFTPNGTGKVVFKGVTGNGGNGAGRFVLNCEQNSHGITIQGPPHSASASYTLTLPNNIVNGQYLKTDGSGNLSWDTPGSSLTTEQVQDIVGAMFTGNTETNITATYQDSDGTIDLIASGGGGGGASLVRSSASAATSSMSNNSSRNITITTAKSYALQKIQTSAAAWVTLYTDTTSRSNDSGRSEATDPTPGSGVIAEVITTGATSQLISPFIIGGNMDSTPSTNAYLKVVNKSGSTQAITVTLYYVPLEV